ncbi:hypothetical protein [Paenibacillus piscarius]|uniref:hypothetical protein n=1 Tax=Paenibacillus piscarius TaxID=1089681 RepID=UPI001EE97AAE|nr:hypothetical protein [Paenibacillus piscarius]
MDKYDDWVEQFYKAQRGYDFLTSFHFTRDTELMGFEVSLQITLTKSTFDHDRKVLITFTGVQDLKLGDFAGIYSIFFDIANISTYQLEGIKYKVEDVEEHVFSFYCRNFTFEFIG